MSQELLIKVRYGFMIFCMIMMAFLIVGCLIRAIKGPRLTDRIVSGNMIGTMTIITIALLSVALGESYLLDVCLIYAMVSFIAVVVLTKVYMGVYRERQKEKKGEKKNA
jgi:multicomponent Na+:H+ antiporter subunit F